MSNILKIHITIQINGYLVSKYYKKLYCWPCLLFLHESNVWSKYGFGRMVKFLPRNNEYNIKTINLYI